MVVYRVLNGGVYEMVNTDNRDFRQWNALCKFGGMVHLVWAIEFLWIVDAA